MKILLLSLLFLIIPLGPAREFNLKGRCMTEPKSVEGAVKASKAVFSGKVVSFKEENGLKQARFKVAESWKGVETEEVIVLVNARLAESPRYRVGESYLVFAVERDGKLFTGACSRTKQLDRAAEDLKQLGEGTRP